MTPAEAATKRAAIIRSVLGSAAGSGFRIAFDRCESPIEQAFCLALFQVEGVVAVEGHYSPRATASSSIYVFAQQPIIGYRADFLLVGTSPIRAEPTFVIVECDGKDYHSGEARVRDQARDQALASTGFRILRFSGGDIFYSPERVIDTTLAAFSDTVWLHRLFRAQLHTLRPALDQLSRAAA